METITMEGIHEGKLLKKAIKLKFDNIEVFAATNGIPKSTLYYNFNKEILEDSFKEQMEQAVGISFNDPDSMFNTFGNMTKSLDEFPYTDLPFIPVKARASFNYEVFSDQLNEPEETYRVLNFNPKPGKKYVAIQINGDSMGPQLKSDTVVSAYELNHDEWSYVTGVVAISYSNHFEVKRIKNNQLLSTGVLTLHSDAENGGSFQVKIDDIKAIWKVDDIIKSKVE